MTAMLLRSAVTRAWGSPLDVAGGSSTTINGHRVRGSARALNPATGAAGWQSCATPGPVLGTIAAAPGVVAVPAGASVLLLNPATGKQLFAFPARGCSRSDPRRPKGSWCDFGSSLVPEVSGKVDEHDYCGQVTDSLAEGAGACYAMVRPVGTPTLLG